MVYNDQTGRISLLQNIQGLRIVNDTVEKAINSFCNTMKKNTDPNLMGQYYDLQAQILMERIRHINQNHPNRPELVRYAIFRVFFFFHDQFEKQVKKGKEDLQENAIYYIANQCDRIHSAMPSLRLKELLIGLCVAKFRFLLPEAPLVG